MKAICKTSVLHTTEVKGGGMTDLNSLYKQVIEILQVVKKSRESDMWLYVQVCKRKNIDALSLPFYLVMGNYEKYGLPVFESVSRARRKAQEEQPELKPSQEICEKRKEYEQMYFDWVTGGING